MTPAPLAPWHALLAPLPDDAAVKRRPVLPPEIAAKPESAAVAGWEQLTVELSVPGRGMRHLLVVLDATGRAISASDMVMYRAEFGEDVVFFQETVGGRLEEDGSFRGTRWRTLGLESAKEEEAKLDPLPSVPSEADAQALKGLVAEIMKRSIIAAP
ncbi:MAG TPA: hypothetical protein VFP62_03520 [Burkholderiales bacterium]|nr:hypothetical protein [Burkholderiales bacterium]